MGNKSKLRKGGLIYVCDKEKFQKRFSLVLVSLALLLDGMLNMVIIPIIPEYLKFMPNQTETATSNDHYEYNKNDVIIGFLFATKPFIQLIISPISGTIIDHIGYRLPMILGLFIQFVSTIIFTYTDSLKGLFLARLSQGVGSALAATSGFAMIANVFRETVERSKALGITITALALGSFLSVPFSGFLFEFVDKKAPFIALAVLALIDCVLLLSNTFSSCKFQNNVELSEGVNKNVKKTPIHKLLLDPYIAICSMGLIMANVSFILF